MDRRKGGESFEDWLKRKEEKKVKPVGFSSLKRGGRLKPVSKKQQKKLQAYAKARTEHYSDEDNRSCFICGSTESLSVHHSAKRGNNIADTSKFITLCLTGSYLADLHPELNSAEGCHNFVEKNKTWARENGYLE